MQEICSGGRSGKIPESVFAKSKRVDSFSIKSS